MRRRAQSRNGEKRIAHEACRALPADNDPGHDLVVEVAVVLRNVLGSVTETTVTVRNQVRTIVEGAAHPLEVTGIDTKSIARTGVLLLPVLRKFALNLGKSLAEHILGHRMHPRITVLEREEAAVARETQDVAGRIHAVEMIPKVTVSLSKKTQRNAKTQECRPHRSLSLQ